jgi:4-nitrophenyl phosphatase
LAASLLDRYSAFAFDLDGVIWLAGGVLPDAAQAIDAVRKAGKPLLFLTNNASYLPSYITSRLAEGGIQASEREILTSASAARSWIRRHGLVGKRAFVLGTRPVVDQLAEVVEVVPVERGASVDLVFVARDLDLTYDRLAAASDAVRNGATFVTSNRDNVMPTPDGFEPGTGSVLAAIEAASARRAISVGKPEQAMMEAAAAVLGYEGVLMIGDRPDSDVAGARCIGWDAALVMTGVTRPGDALDPAPDYVLRTLADLTASGVGD